MAIQPHQSASPPRVGFYFTQANRFSYLIAKTVALGGSQVFVRHELPLADLAVRLDEYGAAEREYSSWLYSEDDIHIVNDAESLPELDALLYQITYIRPKHAAHLRDWISKARHVAGWDSNDHEQTWRSNLRVDLLTAIRNAELLPRTRNVIIQSGRTFLRPTGVLARTWRQGYFTHPKFLREDTLRNEMFSAGWDAGSQRPIRLIFSGNPEPQSRRQIVDAIYKFLQQSARTQILSHYEDVLNRPAPSNVQSVLWMTRSEAHDPKWYLRSDVVPPVKWPAVLRLSDFSICPPGFERKTHRVIESILQGVIPILDCPREYNLGLRDGVNCLVVRRGHWNDALTRALNMTQSEVLEMRRTICTRIRGKLDLSGAAQRWLMYLGLKH